MAVFNAVGDQPDHAEPRARRRARRCSRPPSGSRPSTTGWPRFRAGLATGPAAVGHVGTPEQRSFAAIGDTTNLAARLQAQAEPGEVVVAGVDRRALLPAATASAPVGHAPRSRAVRHPSRHSSAVV